MCWCPQRPASTGSPGTGATQVVVSHLMEVLGPKPGFSVIAVRTVNSWVFLQPSKDFWLFFFFTLSMNRVSLFLGRVFPVVQACREFIMSSG